MSWVTGGHDARQKSRKQTYAIISFLTLFVCCSFLPSLLWLHGEIKMNIMHVCESTDTNCIAYVWLGSSSLFGHDIARTNKHQSPHWNSEPCVYCGPMSQDILYQGDCSHFMSHSTAHKTFLPDVAKVLCDKVYCFSVDTENRGEQWCKQNQILKTRTKMTKPRPRPPEVNKGTWNI